MNVEKLGGNGRGLGEELYRHLPGRTEENLERLKSEQTTSRPRIEPSTSRIKPTASPYNIR